MPLISCIPCICRVLGYCGLVYPPLEDQPYSKKCTLHSWLSDASSSQTGGAGGGLDGGLTNGDHLPSYPILRPLFIPIMSDKIGMSDVIQTWQCIHLTYATYLHVNYTASGSSLCIQKHAVCWLEKMAHHRNMEKVLSEEGSKTSQNMSHSESAGLCCASG
jgi:hypothetical protein